MSDKPDQLAGTASGDTESNAKALASLSDFLRRYSPQGDAARDTLREQFRVDFAMPLPEFDSKTARAYAATDLTDPARSLFALVCQPDTVQRQRAIEPLLALDHPAILKLVAAGAVGLSQRNEDRLVLFYERPAGKKLSELLARNTVHLNESFVCDRIVAPLTEAIEEFSKLGLSHGLLNPDNIYFSDHAILGPCLSEPCGLSQPFYFEPLERMQAMPAGKGEGSVAQDYYALAVLVLHIMYGKEHFAAMTPENLPRAILKEGVYNAMTRQREMPEMFFDFFRGLLCANPDDRWGYNHIKFWLAGKRYNVLIPPPPMEALRPFEYGDELASTRRELAHLYASDWEHMAASIQSNKLAHWCAVSLRNKDLSEGIARITRAITEAGQKNDIQISEQLMRILMLLDAQGPVRLKQLSFHIDGIDSLCATLYIGKAHQDLQLLAKFVEMNMVSYWPGLQRKGQDDYVIPPLINAMILKLERLRTYIRNTGMGFGMERMLYDLNPDLSCQSPLLGGSYVNTIAALLRRLDRLAQSMSGKEDPLDRHIAAFLASKLGIQHELRVHDLAAMPALAKNRSILSLYILSLAQQKCGNLQLPGLTHWLGVRIMPLLDGIHSKTLRHKFKSLLLDSAQSGFTQRMAEILINPEFATADQTGYSQAYRVYHSNAAKIESYRQGTYMEEKSARMGFTMAKVLAYASVCMSLLFVLKDIDL